MIGTLSHSWPGTILHDDESVDDIKSHLHHHLANIQVLTTHYHKVHVPLLHIWSTYRTYS